MALITWNNSYSVGVREIDVQHQKLVGLINSLHDAMKEGKGKDILSKTLKEMVDYTVYHFTFEEKLFAKYNYPETSKHIQQHNDLISQVKKFTKDYESGKSIITQEVMSFLKEWLLNHIGKTDKQYTEFFNKNGVS